MMSGTEKLKEKKEKSQGQREAQKADTKSALAHMALTTTSGSGKERFEYNTKLAKSEPWLVVSDARTRVGAWLAT